MSADIWTRRLAWLNGPVLADLSVNALAELIKALLHFLEDGAEIGRICMDLLGWTRRLGIVLHALTFELSKVVEATLTSGGLSNI